MCTNNIYIMIIIQTRQGKSRAHSTSTNDYNWERKEGRIDHQHHTNKATTKRTEGGQERALKEEEEERLTDKETVDAEKEDEEAKSMEEGGETPTMARC